MFLHVCLHRGGFDLDFSAPMQCTGCWLYHVTGRCSDVFSYPGQLRSSVCNFVYHILAADITGASVVLILHGVMFCLPGDRVRVFTI